MKRRDLLKGAGALAFATPVVRALTGSALNPGATSAAKDLIVSFAGPFCFWLETDSVKVMAPPVGPDYLPAPHQPWFGTTANEKPVSGAATDYKLVINGYIQPASLPVPSGTSVFNYEQGTGSGVAPLFNLSVPIPNQVIGIVPTVVKMICSPGTPDPYCTQWNSYSSGLTFVYKNVDLQGVHILQGASDYFHPCFINDEALPAAGLGIHLTQMDRHPDPHHVHAKKVWSQMLAMYPWMNKEITGIEFCPDFDPAVCNFDPAQCGTAKSTRQKNQPPGRLLVGYGSDCEVPDMLLRRTGSKAKLQR